MSSTRAVLQVFEKYQKDRVTFVQTVAELATRPQVSEQAKGKNGNAREADGEA